MESERDRYKEDAAYREMEVFSLKRKRDSLETNKEKEALLSRCLDVLEHYALYHECYPDKVHCEVCPEAKSLLSALSEAGIKGK